MAESLPVSNAFKRSLHIGQICLDAVSDASSNSLIKEVPNSTFGAFVAACFKLTNSSLSDFVTVGACEVDFSSRNVHGGSLG